MKPLEINLATELDLEAVANLFDAYRVFYQQKSDLPSASLFIKERLTQKDSLILLARLKGVAAGFVQIYPSLSSVSMGPIYILNDLYVSSEARNQGIGKALMLAAQTLAQQNKILRLALTTAVDNRTAQKLYESCGWVKDETYFTYELDLSNA